MESGRRAAFACARAASASSRSRSLTSRYRVSRRRWMRVAVHLDRDDHALVHGGGQRLRAAHPAQPRGDHEAAGAGVPPKCWRAASANVS